MNRCHNRFRQSLQQGETLIGCWSALGNPISTEVLDWPVSTGWCWTASMRRMISPPLCRS
ncbi:5-keto-4-deoxy-D-glucarate aldolase [Serratia rubidaea]|uniref:5-keto-4-deoxy-D-glucarate aldolase n=1 Tax=Serratia rubidaea TaxID=61652 RepID=A0A447QPC9_SERRU|nr:5-keto-4-deoxy-D-glucarate aldolase [Serratia rubidaea]